jgi:hypothetical protein
MKSTSKTGNQYQDWCAKMLMQLYPGCAIHNQKSVARFLPSVQRWVSQRNDILGCIDIICIVPGLKPLFIQCTAHKSFTEKLKELAKVPWPLHYVDVQVWMKRAPGRTEIRQLADDGEEFELHPAGEIKNRKLLVG